MEELLKEFWEDYDRTCEVAEAICKRYREPICTEEDKAKFKVLFEYFELAEAWRFYSDSKVYKVLTEEWYKRIGSEYVKANELTAFYITYRNYFNDSDFYIDL